MEIWKDVVGLEGAYQVSSHGRVKSLDRVAVNSKGHSRRLQGLLIQPQANANGYLFLKLGRNTPAMVHTLVAAAFIGPRPVGTHICHNDGNKQNNDPANLRYDTAYGNQADRKRHGTHRCGERAARALLTEIQVKEIRRRLAQGETHKSIAPCFNISRATVTAISTGRNWSYLKD